MSPERPGGAASDQCAAGTKTKPETGGKNAFRRWSPTMPPPKQLDDIQGKSKWWTNRSPLRFLKIKTSTRASSPRSPCCKPRSNVVDDQVRRCYIRHPITGTVLLKLAEPHEMTVPVNPCIPSPEWTNWNCAPTSAANNCRQIQIGKQVEVLIDEDKENNKKLTEPSAGFPIKPEFTPKPFRPRKNG